ncbi:MAG: TonB-dependent receptor [Gammaproteobacteria bacterium]
MIISARTIRLAAVAASLAAGTAGAAESTGGSALLEEVTVTAQRRTENLQKVPVAVQSLMAEDLDSRGVSNMMELQRATPSLTVGQTGCCTSPFIRGVGSVNAGGGQFTSVAVYLDGIYIGQQTGLSFMFDDAEQIQVLKGPQGALYGRNATGGAIVISTRTPRPGDPFSGEGKFEYGNYDAQTYSGSLSGSMGDMFAGYVKAYRRTHDGYVENINPPGTGYHSDDFNDADSWGITGALTFEPNDRLRIVGRASHYDQEDRAGLGLQAVGLDIPIAGTLNGTQAYYAATLQAFGVPPVQAGAAAAGLQFSRDIYETYSNLRNGWQNGILPGEGLPGSFNALETNRGSLGITYRFDRVEVSTLTSYTDALNRIAIDFITASPTSYPPGLEGGSIGFSASYPFRDFQQDLQISSIDTPIRWVGGVSYYNSRGKSVLSADLPGGLSFIAGDNVWKVDSKSVFGQATVPISGPWSVTGGARYTEESNGIIDAVVPTRPTTLPGQVNVGRREVDSSQATYTARLEYERDGFLAYAGVVTGFKGALLNPANPSTPAVDPEELTSYEGGFKWDITKALRVNGAVFHYSYDNVQVSYIDTASGANVLINGEGAQVTGLEAESIYQANEWLRLRGSALWLDTHYENDVLAPSGTLVLLPIGDNRLGGAPEVVITAGADVEFVIAGGTVSGSLDLLYSGGYFFDPMNLTGTGGASADSYATVDIGVEYQPANRPWWVAIRGVNVTGEEYYQGSLVASGILREALPATPALVSVSLGVRF